MSRLGNGPGPISQSSSKISESGLGLAEVEHQAKIGGFSGSDNVIDVTQLAQMIADGELRFVLGSQRLAQQKPEIAGYLANSCTIVSIPGVAQPGPTGKQPLSPGGPGEPNILYDCDIY